ncbi:hypothetical protein BFP76_11410 [Amylibacter kogurei]|uniref:NAD-dependent epimerase/dehydratase domain-containing protein n=1 Tax=Paramylibacter kogurei TaxID=1889778 RepID=A0A2G5KBF6_9RHOB|nr:NAD-dependent epimerase/dehydratase family protein [Amylibacter kogurei]PIB26509.1 hypothetical protein BFP76_11410 [Amylibacter kogurei]
MSNSVPIAFSGANGMVGIGLSQALEQHKDATPLALSRVGADGERQCPDLMNCTDADWHHALKGAQVYIHLAAYLPFGNQTQSYSDDEYNIANCAAAVSALNGFAIAGGQKMIFVSTLGINGITSGQSPFSWDDKPNPASAYATSKYNAETALRARAKQLGIQLIIVRPPIIYGQNVGGKFRQLVDHIKSQRPLPFGTITNMRDMIGLRNFCDVLVALALNTKQWHNPVLVCDREPVSTPDLVKKIANAYGVAPRLINVPRPVFQIAAKLPIIGKAVQRLCDDLRINDQYLRDNCDWTPRFSVQDELDLMAASETHQQNP